MSNLWKELKRCTEKSWEHAEIDPDCWGYQIVAGTRWNPGLSEHEINQLQHRLGFAFPSDYIEMLRTFNGFDRDCVDVRGGEEPSRHRRSFYKYPDDLLSQTWLLEDLETHRAIVNAVLEGEGFDSADVVGFIPIYGHRALVAFTDPTLSPVLSVVGSDAIIYGQDLQSYFRHEFDEELRPQESVDARGGNRS